MTLSSEASKALNTLHSTVKGLSAHSFKNKAETEQLDVILQGIKTINEGLPLFFIIRHFCEQNSALFSSIDS